MGEFFPKIFFGIFLYTFGRGDYARYLDILGGRSQGRIRAPHIQGRGMGELTGRGYTKTPTIKDGG